MAALIFPEFWHRSLPWFSAFGVFIILNSILRWPSQWHLGLALIALVAVVTGFLVINSDWLFPVAPTTDKQSLLRSWWYLLPAPVLLSVVALVLLLFLEKTPWARELLIVLAAALTGFFWENVRRHLHPAEIYPRYYLESASLLIHVAVVWLAAAGFFRLLLDPTVLPQNFANNAYVISTVIMIVAVFLLDYRAIWLMRYPAASVWLFLVVESLLIGEFFWMLNLLPLSPDVKAFLLAIEYYAVAALARSHFDGTLRLAVVRRYVYFILIIVTAVLITARWLV